VELSEAILSRFDVLCVVRDVIDETKDRQLARFVVKSHSISHPNRRNNREVILGLEEEVAGSNVLLKQRDNSPISQELLKKFIVYAKTKYKPRLININTERICKFYTDLRKEAKGGMPVTVRHLESILRLSEASAKMHLREIVEEEDVDLAIKVTTNTFVASQKHSVAEQLRRYFAKYVPSKEEPTKLCLHILRGLLRETEHEIERSSFEAKALSKVSERALAKFYMSSDFNNSFTRNEKTITLTRNPSL